MSIYRKFFIACMVATGLVFLGIVWIVSGIRPEAGGVKLNFAPIFLISAPALVLPFTTGVIFYVLDKTKKLGKGDGGESTTKI